MYYVTICIQNRECLFGEIKNGKIILNECGKIVQRYWQEIPNHYPNVKLDQWVIMPNHIHGIIVISDNKHPVRTEQCSVLTGITNMIKPIKSISLSQIIKSFKGVTTKQIQSRFPDICFAWQRSFYDHIIRYEITLNKIREYIANNTVRWAVDGEPWKVGAEHCSAHVE
jgi:REP element-mobilizing transposase RayT